MISFADNCGELFQLLKCKKYLTEYNSAANKIGKDIICQTQQNKNGIKIYNIDAYKR